MFTSLCLCPMYHITTLKKDIPIKHIKSDVEDHPVCFRIVQSWVTHQNLKVTLQQLKVVQINPNCGNKNPPLEERELTRAREGQTACDCGTFSQHKGPWFLFPL